jgi:hypothetical protein
MKQFQFSRDREMTKEKEIFSSTEALYGESTSSFRIMSEAAATSAPVNAHAITTDVCRTQGRFALAVVCNTVKALLKTG